MVTDIASNEAGLSFSRPADGSVVLHLTGRWETGESLPSIDEALHTLESAPLQTVSFDASGLITWDSNLLTFLIRIKKWCTEKNVVIGRNGEVLKKEFLSE